MFEILKKTGLTQGDLATLFKVSRITMNNWMTGKTNPHALIRAAVDLKLKAIGAALRAKALPLPDTVEKKHKMKEAKAVLTHYLAA